MRQGFQHVMTRGQGRAGDAPFEPAQRAGDAAIRRQHAAIIMGTPKVAAFRRQPVAVARRIAVDRGSPAVLETAAQKVAGLDIAAAGRT